MTISRKFTLLEMLTVIFIISFLIAAISVMSTKMFDDHMDLVMKDMNEGVDAAKAAASSSKDGQAEPQADAEEDPVPKRRKEGESEEQFMLRNCQFCDELTRFHCRTCKQVCCADCGTLGRRCH